MELKKLGELMQHWHSSGGDPIYAAGSFLASGGRHPLPAMEERALEELVKIKREGKVKSVRDLNELTKIIDALVALVLPQVPPQNVTIVNPIWVRKDQRYGEGDGLHDTSVLRWSGDPEISKLEPGKPLVPWVGEKVKPLIVYKGFDVSAGTVVGYLVEHGWLYLVVKVQPVTGKRNGQKASFLWGSDNFIVVAGNDLVTPLRQKQLRGALLGVRGGMAQVTGNRIVWEPGDMTHYEAVVMQVPGDNAVLALLSPRRGAMKLPTDWQDGMHADYVAEKLGLKPRDVTAERVCDMLSWYATR